MQKIRTDHSETISTFKTDREVEAIPSKTDSSYFKILLLAIIKQNLNLKLSNLFDIQELNHSSEFTESASSYKSISDQKRS